MQRPSSPVVPSETGRTTPGFSCKDILLLALTTIAFAAHAFAAPNLTLIYTFTGGSDGSLPQGSLLLSSEGELFGLTAHGGTSGNGVVFKLTPPTTSGGSWTESVLHSFSGPDGANPAGGLLASSGALFGVTTAGGAFNKGVVFQLKLSGGVWTETVLHSFSGIDGANPSVRLVADAKGALFGITAVGGASNKGVVFKLTPPKVRGRTWTETVIHDFAGSAGTGSVLVIDGAGALYGTTAHDQSAASLFKLTPPVPPNADWTYTVLLNDNATFLTVDGVDTAGTLFGTTLGPNAFFDLSPSGVKQVLVEMGDIYPLPGLAAGPDGALYGGNFGQQVFKLTPPSGKGGSWTVGLVIPSCFNNGMPAVDATGTIYGYNVSAACQAPPYGAVYELTQ
jgi:uncharacterized repeat protein (TIGR03803 family)